MSYNEKSDVWSMGCVLYELCALQPPFTAANQTELSRKIRLGDFSRIPVRYSDDLNAVIGRMLHVEVNIGVLPWRIVGTVYKDPDGMYV